MSQKPSFKLSFKTVGLTGGIAVGKSTVAQLFNKLGIPVLDADSVARQIREPGGAAAPAILARFGTLDRTQLRTLISQDPQAKKDIEAILHPLIQKESEQEMQRLAHANPHAPFILYEATLLVEAGRSADFPALIVVTAPLEDRITRLMARDQCSREQAQNLIKIQSTDEARAKKIASPQTLVIENLGNLYDLEQKVRKALDQLK